MSQSLELTLLSLKAFLYLSLLRRGDSITSCSYTLDRRNERSTGGMDTRPLATQVRFPSQRSQRRVGELSMNTIHLQTERKHLKSRVRIRANPSLSPPGGWLVILGRSSH
ncbi:unnamed protein product [Pleuronectes platessa]|uniref:Secreted protein n=1 Tax=Pleuronectes platessa TaxID=8262 RepID=A0A9N7Y7E8_PLEPL|nr:unnamed protein product [Pleuronectes platessa]